MFAFYLKKYWWIWGLGVLFFYMNPRVSSSNSRSPLEGHKAPEFVSRLLDTPSYRFPNDVTSGKWGVVNFWMAECPACMAEMPELQKFFLANMSRTYFLSVDIGNSEAEVTAVKNQFGLSFPIILDSDSNIAKEWGVLGTPSAFIIDDKGVVRGLLQGEQTAASLKEKVNLLCKCLP